MNGVELVAFDGTTLINGFANDVHDTAECSIADGNFDGSASINNLLTTDETLGTVHGNGTDGVLTKVGRDFQNETPTREVLNLKRVQDGGEIISLKLHIDDGTDDGLDVANSGRSLGSVCTSYTRTMSWQVGQS